MDLKNEIDGKENRSAMTAEFLTERGTDAHKLVIMVARMLVVAIYKEPQIRVDQPVCCVRVNRKNVFKKGRRLRTSESRLRIMCRRLRAVNLIVVHACRRSRLPIDSGTTAGEEVKE